MTATGPHRSDLDLLAPVMGRSEWDPTEVARLVAETCSASGCLVLLVDEERSALRLAGAHPESDATQRAFRLPVGYGVLGLVAAQGRPTLLSDDAPRDEVHRALLGLSEGESVARLCVPLSGLPGSVVGVISVHRSPSHPFGQVDADRLRPLGAVLGMRVEAELLRDRADATTTERDRLIAQAISAQEAERRRISGDLHDGVTQALVSLDYHLSAAAAFLTEHGEPVSESLREIRAARALSGLAYDETRAAISGLHSLILDDLGLEAALESMIQSVGATAPGLEVEFQPDEDGRFDRLAEHIAATLYRIAQEAMNNVVKHSRATQVVVSLRRAGTAAVLAIADDGIGFDSAVARSAASLEEGDAGHFGLSSIAERCALIGANLRIDSVEGRGCVVIVEHDQALA